MADYAFYTGTYLGSSIAEADFPRMARRASEKLTKYKRNYTVTDIDANSEDMAICAMADALYYYEAVANGTGGAVASSSVGSVSTSWQTGTNGIDTSAAGQEKELLRCAMLYLDIYRGVGTC